MYSSEKKSSTIRDSVYKTLKNAIVTGQLRWGEQLKESQLAASFNVSRSPIREALHLLAGDGLVVTYPHRGVFVRSFSKKEVDDFIHLRLIFENRGLALLSTNFTPEFREKTIGLKEELTHAIQSEDFERYTNADNALHYIFVELCRNSLIVKYYEQLNLLLLMLSLFALKSPERQQVSYAEHMLLVHHVLTGNSHEAVAVNTSHLTRTKDELFRIIESMNAIK